VTEKLLLDSFLNEDLWPFEEYVKDGAYGEDKVVKKHYLT